MERAIDCSRLAKSIACFVGAQRFLIFSTRQEICCLQKPIQDHLSIVSLGTFVLHDIGDKARRCSAYASAAPSIQVDPFVFGRS